MHTVGPGSCPDNAGRRHGHAAFAVTTLLAGLLCLFVMAGCEKSKLNMPSKLAFGTQPTTTSAGATIAPAVTVRVLDARGYPVTSATTTITLALGANPGGGTLSGTVTANAVNGIATFANLSIDKAGAGYTLRATAANLTAATSTPFNITLGQPAKLAFVTQPGTTAVGTSITPAVMVCVQDAAGNSVPTATNAIKITFIVNPTGALLSGTLTKTAVGGIATFNDLSVSKIGVGYKLYATSAGLTSVRSAAFNVTVGAPSQLVFGVQPVNTTAGRTITPAVTVRVLDVGGNPVTTATNAVTLALGANPGGGTLSGTLTKAAVNGVATFSNISINKVGNGYTLNATATGLTAATSSPFNITAGTPAQLAFGIQPCNTTAGASITPAVTVRVLDAGGNLVTSATTSVTLALGDNPGGGTLAGTLTKSAVGGTATFDNLSINKVGVGYTLRATATGLMAATSLPFTINAGTPAQLIFGIQPTNAAAGAAITPAVTVRILDAGGNLVTTAANDVTMAIYTNPGGGTLSGTLTVAAVDGTAAFDNLSIDKAGTGYTLQATAADLSAATSSSFNITAGEAAQLAFNVQPTDTPPGMAILPAVAVRVLDALGNHVTSATDAVTLALGANPGGGTLSGTLTKNAVGGTATFNDLSIDTEGDGYTLVATATGLTSATSMCFDIVPGETGILNQYNQRLQAIQIPPITVVAEDVVTYQMDHPEMLIRYAWPLSTQLAFSDEFIARSGSLANWEYYHPAGGEQTSDIMIYAIRSWDEDAAEAAAALPQFRQHGYQIILIASSAGMPEGLPYDYFIDNGADTGTAEETRVNMLVNITICRYWQCEYVAACTRMLGAHPGVLMSAELPGGPEFDAALVPIWAVYPTDADIPAGSLSEAFKTRLDWLVGQLGGPVLAKINSAADIIASRMMTGQRVGLTSWNHAIPFEMYHAMESPFFAFDCWNYTTAFKDNMEPGELLVFFGYAGLTIPPDADSYIGEAGVDLIPSFRPVLDPLKNAPDALERLDQSWELGDAEVPVPFAPDKMAPMSVINGLLIMRMLDEAVNLRLDTWTPAESKTFTSSADFEGCTRDAGIDTTTTPGSVLLAPVDHIIEDVGNKIGPACGIPDFQGMKLFHLDATEATAATVYIFRGTTAATFNGTPITFTPVPGTRGWFAADIPIELLQAGDNEFIMTSGCLVPIDTEHDAGHSYFSTDGSSWQAAPGEYLAHLRLFRYPSQGVITSDVIDVANLENQDVICPSVNVNYIHVGYASTTTEGINAVQLEARTGNSLRPDDTWTAWGPATAITPARYLQWRATLSSTDHSETPVLESVTVTCLLDAAPATGLTLNDFSNQKIARSSFPFTYQPPSAKLTTLRENWNLDAVVAPGATEMGKFTLLQQWVRKQWPHNEGSCTRPWDTVDILNAPEGDHGMCTHFATVFTQCALALGYNARHTVLMHHCVSEVWSDEYKKWVLIDEEATQPEGWDRYGTAIYLQGGVPLNAREIHEAWKNDNTLGITQVLYMSDDGGNTYQEYDRNYPPSDYTTCYMVFMHPKRNNHLDQDEPWEEAQGNDYYHSNDYYIWSDDPVPDYEEFSSFSCREADSYWTLNQAQMTLTATGDPGQLAVSVTTETPNFKEFRYRLDGGAWQSLAGISCGGISQVASYTWELAVGANTLEIMPRNTFDCDGIVTTVSVTRAP